MTFDIDKIGEAWCVVDQTGAIATLNDIFLYNLDMDDADDLVDLLNWIEATRPPLDH